MPLLFRRYNLLFEFLNQNSQEIVRMASIKAFRFFSSSHILSAADSTTAMIRPPIQVSGIEGKYASALYSSGIKEKVLDVFEKEVKQVKLLFDTDKEFKDFVQDPVINKLKKKSVIEEILKSQGLSKHTQNFFGLLAENGQLKKLSAVTKTFDEIMRAHRRELPVQVTSAEPLTKSQEQSLQDALKKFASEGQKLNMSFEVKPSLLGGLVVTIGDKYIDLSIASKLKKLDQTLQNTI